MLKQKLEHSAKGVDFGQCLADMLNTYAYGLPSIAELRTIRQALSTNKLNIIIPCAP